MRTAEKSVARADNHWVRSTFTNILYHSMLCYIALIPKSQGNERQLISSQLANY